MGRGYKDNDSRRYFDWLFHANLDFLAAKNLIKDTRCYSLASFHCQQCIEKALKGYLLFKKHKLYDGHNLHGSVNRRLFATITLNNGYQKVHHLTDSTLKQDIPLIFRLILILTLLKIFFSQQQKCLNLSLNRSVLIS